MAPGRKTTLGHQLLDRTQLLLSRKDQLLLRRQLLLSSRVLISMIISCLLGWKGDIGSRG